MSDIFLTCQWKNLAMVNFEIDPDLLAPFIPPGTTLDFFQGKALITLLGFQYEDTRLKGCAVCGHQRFSEINLRFYVKRTVEGQERRGVCFLKEIVSLPLAALVANVCYAENFQTLDVRSYQEQKALGAYMQYQVVQKKKISVLEMMALGPRQDLEPGTIEEFIVDHRFAYSAQQNGPTLEYHIERPSWHYWDAAFVYVDFNAQALYGQAFAQALKARPHSAFLVDGGPVRVYAPRPIPDVAGHTIVIFDGICHLCNGFVDFILKHDKREAFVLLPNQSGKARKILTAFDLNDQADASVYVVQGGKIYKESTAALRILKTLGFPFSLLYAAIFVPPMIRNIFYRVVARNRYRWFGKQQTCRFLPSEELEKGETS